MAMEEKKSLDSMSALPSPGQTEQEGSQDSGTEIMGDANRKGEAPSLSQGCAAPKRCSRPNRELYRPPGARVSEAASAAGILMSSHDGAWSQPLSTELSLGCSQARMQRSPLTMHSGTPLTAGRPRQQNEAVRVRSSEMITRKNSEEEAEVQDEFMPTDFPGLLGRALSNPSILDTDELEWLAVSTFVIATKTVDYAGPAAQVCGVVAARVADEFFLQKLLTLAEDGFSERKISVQAAGARPQHLSWLPFVAFLAELLVRLSSEDIGNSTMLRAVAAGEPAMRTTQQLAMLLCKCCRALLCFPSPRCCDEIESLRVALTVAGENMETEVQGGVEAVFNIMRQSFLLSRLSASARLALLELLELRASGWHMTEQQREYYDSRRSAISAVQD